MNTQFTNLFSFTASSIPSPWAGSSVKSPETWFTPWATRICRQVSTNKTIFALLLWSQGNRVSCQSVNICSKLVESNVGNVSVDSLVQLEGHLETALTLTRARKVRDSSMTTFFLLCLSREPYAYICIVADRSNVEACWESQRKG